MDLVNPYTGFSEVFDKIVSESKYEKWEKFIKKIWIKNNFAPTSLVDLACGTGRSSNRFNKNIEIFGVDFSEEMLKKAKERSPTTTYLYGHFLNFNLPKKVDGAFCLDFSINYLLRTNEFIEFLNRVYNNLNNKGIFIFDFKPTKNFIKKQKNIKKC